MRPALVTLLLAGCFGAGPTPSVADKATTIFTMAQPTGQSCSGNARYIGDVAIGTTRGFVIGLPYIPDGCNNGGGNTGTANVELSSFDLTGVDPTVTSRGTAGSVGPGMELPRVAVAGDTPSWAFLSTVVANQLAVAIGSDASPIVIATPMNDGPAGIVVTPDGTTVVAGQARQMTFTSFEDPQFPCCGFGFSALPAPIDSFVATIPPGGTDATRLPINLGLFCDTLDSCVVTTSTRAFVVEHLAGGTSGARVRGYPFGATSDNDGVTIGQMTTDDLAHVVPVGMAADDTGVVFAASQDPTSSFGAGCKIWRYDLQTQTLATLLSTTSFSCQDVAIDASAAYFAITEVVVLDSGARMRGVGLGRVGFDLGVATVRLGLAGPSAGPRRVVVNAGYLYAIDPLAIGRIATRDLTGQDFVP